jgi:hypothetical protein
MRLVVFLLAIFSIVGLFAAPANARVFNPVLLQDIFAAKKISLSYEEYTRETEFFYEYKKDVSISNYLVTLAGRTRGDFEMYADIAFGQADVDGRKSTDYGYEVRLGVSRDIWGDLELFPIWKWSFSVSRGAYELTKYQENKIQMDLNFTSLGMSVMTAKKIKRFIPYAGISFTYNMDKFEEKTTGTTESSTISDFSPFAGLKISITERIFLTWKSAFSGEKSSFGALEISL